jgi:hypothetical protein
VPRATGRPAKPAGGVLVPHPGKLATLTVLWTSLAYEVTLVTKRGKTDSSVGRHVERKYTYNDALAAAEALREISAGHEQAAQAVLNGAGLDALSNEELQALCHQFGVEPS